MLTKEMVDGIKKSVSAMRSMCKIVDDQGLVRNIDDDNSLVDTFNSDILKFMLYLMASDGGVSDEEVRLINALLDVELNSAQCVEIIQQCGIYSVGFESNVPVAFQVITALGRNVYHQEFGEAVFDLYRNVGNAVILSDDSVHPQEMEDLDIYLKMLRTHLDEEH